LFFLHLPFPLVVLGAAIIGAVLPRHFHGAGHGIDSAGSDALIDRMFRADPDRPRRQGRSARRAGMAALAVWLLPVAILVFAIGGTYGDIAAFFTKMAVV
ncbi:MAG: chromate transporter, partial [Parvibaculum sp.]